LPKGGSKAINYGAYGTFDPRLTDVDPYEISRGNVTSVPGTTGGGGGGTSGGGGGYGGIPDYLGMIEGDPMYIQLLADLKAQGVGDAAARKLARNRALVQFGYMPDFNSLDQQLLGGDLQSDIDPTTPGLIERGNEAGTTTKARLELAHKDAVRNITNALASRGLLRSGETGFQLGREKQQYDVANYDASQKLVDYLAGVQAAFMQSERIRQGEKRAGASDAYQRSLQLAGLGFGGAGGGGGGAGYYSDSIGGKATGNGTGNFFNASSPNQLDTSGGWGVQWEGPGRYEARKFGGDPGQPAGNTVWVKVGDLPGSPPPAPQAGSPQPTNTAYVAPTMTPDDSIAAAARKALLGTATTTTSGTRYRGQV
jgi:hypothetical protein